MMFFGLICFRDLFICFCLLIYCSWKSDVFSGFLCTELLIKFGESCGSSVILKCKLPTEDLDVLVSIKSDEELQIVIGEYKRVSPDAKIRAVLFPVKSVKKVTPPSSPVSCFDFPSAPKPKLPPRPPVNRNIPVKPVKKVSPPSSPVSCFDFPSAPKPQARPHSGERYYAAAPPCPTVHRYTPWVFVYPTTAGSARSCDSRSPMHFYHVPHQNFTH